MRLLFVSVTALLSFTISYLSSVEEIVKSKKRDDKQDEVNLLKTKSIDTKHEGVLVSIPKNETLLELQPVLSKDFVGFKEALGFRESSGRYNVVSKTGYIGKYQFGKHALIDLKIRDKNKFLNSPEYQEKAFLGLCSVNKYRLRNYIPKYSGKVIGGIEITESGMLAAAHLLGAGAVKAYMKSGGRISGKDGLGTSIKEYLSRFSGYDTSDIIANRSVEVKLS